MIESLDAHLIIYPEDDRTAAGIRQRDDFLRHAFRIRQFDFQFNEGVFAAADQAHQFSARGLRRAARVEVLLERAFGDRLVALVAAKSSASHLCNGGAGQPRRREGSKLPSLESWAGVSVRTHPGS